jgi:hypothetical protein
MKSAQQRIAAYAARMVSSIIDPVLAVVKDKAQANFTTYVLDFYPNQLALRTLLADAGIPTVEYGAYEAYHGELYHLSKVTSGAGLVTAAQGLIDKWSDSAHLGAGAAVLLASIAADVYHITLLGTP